MNSLVKKALDGQFFRYEGSLTTPGCFEAVTWTVFETPLGVSRKQAMIFPLALALSGTAFNPDECFVFPDGHAWFADEPP